MKCDIEIFRRKGKHIFFLLLDIRLNFVAICFERGIFQL